MGMTKPLETELEIYKKNLPNLLGEQGKFVLISGNQIVGIFGTYEDALTIGYEKFGLQPFLVKKISAVEQVQRFTRDLDVPCPT